MKQLSVVIFTFFSLILNAQYALKDAIKFAVSNEYDKAIELYSLEIISKEADQDENVLSLYNERGDLFFAKKQFSEALMDYQTVVSRVKKGDNSNLLKGICGKLFCYLFLNEDQLAEEEFNYLVDEVALIGNDIENIEWIKNSPVHHYYKENIEGKRKKPCECKKMNQLFINQTQEIPADSPQEHCTTQYNGFAVACYVACSRVGNPFIQGICIGCIFGLEQVCMRCCKGDGFWKNCITPLRRLYHDPAHPESPAPHPYE